MKGDFSRLTFDAKKRYSSVRMQQGRLQIDADWNEQLDITEHRIATEIGDFIGQSGAPLNDAGFRIGTPHGLQFDGNNQYVDLGNVLNPASSDWTIELWFRWDGIVGSRNGPDDTYILYNKEDLYEAGIAPRGSKGYFQFAWQPDWAWKPAPDAKFEITPGQWYHAAVVYDHAKQYVYLHKDNGDLASSETGSLTTNIGANDQKLLIGARGNTNPGGFFNGAIDEVRIWNRARSQQEIQANLNRSLSGTEPGLMGCWSFDERADETTAYDLTPSGNNGTLQNGPKRVSPPPVLLAPLSVGAGRYYIDGMLFENHADVLFTNQPDYPGATLPAKKEDEGIYLAYLDVWQRHISALEDPDIAEPALGGADTATRIKNTWQVKLRRLADLGAIVDDKGFVGPWRPGWEQPISTGRMSAQVSTVGTVQENQLYRAEIHSVDQKGTTVKWSRDNGSVAARVSKIAGDTITVSGAGREAQASFAPTQWVELTNEERTLQGGPGILVELAAVQGDDLTVVAWPDEVQGKDLWGEAWPGDRARAQQVIMRRWDSAGALSVTQGEPILLDNIQVEFETGGGASYKPSDYWLIPARQLTGNIEWPRDDKGKPVLEPPHGTLHHYSALALLQLNDNQWSVARDLRATFQPLTTGLVSKGGDIITGPLTIQAALDVIGNVTVRGNVGIGTAQPRAGLEINRGAANDVAFRISSSANTWGSGMQFENTATTGRTYGMYSGDDGHWHFVDTNAGNDRLVIESGGNLLVNGLIRSSNWGVKKLFNNQSGPLPRFAEFSTHGGICIVLVSGTASRGPSTGSVMQLEIALLNRTDPTPVLEPETLSVAPDADHKVFPSRMLVFVLQRGSYRLRIDVQSGTCRTDGSDIYNATLLELPFL